MKKQTAIFLIVAAIILLLLIKIQMNSSTKILLETNHGNIVIELYDDMPITTGNFKNLVEKGTYDGVISTE